MDVDQTAKPVQSGPEVPADRPLTVVFGGIAAAAEACQVSEKTILRRREALEANGAYKKDGSWQIPWAALHAAGFTPGKPAGPNGQSGSDDHSRKDDMSDLSGPAPVTLGEYIELVKSVGQLNERLDSRARDLASRDRELDTMRQLVKVLETAPAAHTEVPNPNPAVAVQMNSQPRLETLGFWELRRVQKAAKRAAKYNPS